MNSCLTISMERNSMAAIPLTSFAFLCGGFPYKRGFQGVAGENLGLNSNSTIC